MTTMGYESCISNFIASINAYDDVAETGKKLNALSTDEGFNVQLKKRISATLISKNQCMCLTPIMEYLEIVLQFFLIIKSPIFTNYTKPKTMNQ